MFAAVPVHALHASMAAEQKRKARQSQSSKVGRVGVARKFKCFSHFILQNIFKVPYGNFVVCLPAGLVGFVGPKNCPNDDNMQFIL